MQQLHLPFPEIPQPHQKLWAQLNQQQRQTVIKVLASLIAQSINPNRQTEENKHESQR